MNFWLVRMKHFRLFPIFSFFLSTIYFRSNSNWQTLVLLLHTIIIIVIIIIFIFFLAQNFGAHLKRHQRWWLADCSVNWLVAWLIRWLVCWLINSLVLWLAYPFEKKIIFESFLKSLMIERRLNWQWNFFFFLKSNFDSEDYDQTTIFVCCCFHLPTLRFFFIFSISSRNGFSTR